MSPVDIAIVHRLGFAVFLGTLIAVPFAMLGAEKYYSVMSRISRGNVVPAGDHLRGIALCCAGVLAPSIAFVVAVLTA